jgi:hypothetical protein
MVLGLAVVLDLRRAVVGAGGVVRPALATLAFRPDPRPMSHRAFAPDAGARGAVIAASSLFPSDYHSAAYTVL